MYKKPYLKDILKKSRFPKPWLFRFLGNGGFGDRGIVNIAGKDVELTIVFFDMNNNSSNTHLDVVKYKGGEIRVKNYNGLNVIIFNFYDNMELYNTVIRWFAGGPTPDFNYIKR